MKTTLQPDCLQWARERAALSVPDLAHKLGVKEEKVTSWEQSGEITFAQLEKLAATTHTPLGYLFLPNRPVEQLPVTDFRTIRTEDIGHPSSDLLDIVNDTLRKQDWYRDHLISNGGEPLAFVGSLQISSNILKSAEEIRKVITWNTDVRASARSSDLALSNQIDAVEKAGILVMRSGIVGNNTHRSLSISEFRGFALSDKYAPILFINGKDAKAAQMFTLAHELVHIWLGVSGVSNLNQTYSSNIDVEQFCNAVAAELLVPLIDLHIQWQNIKEHSDNVTRIARYFKVSSLVVLRRLLDADYITRDEFNRLYTDELAQFREKAPESGGGDFYRTLRSRLGKRFTAALVESTLEGRTPYRDAFSLLGVNNSEKIHKLAQLMETPA